MSSTPTRKFHIIQPVVVNQKTRSPCLGVHVQVHHLELLEQDAAVTVDDRLRQAGRPRAVEHPERMVEGHLHGRELGSGGPRKPGSHPPPSRWPSRTTCAPRHRLGDRVDLRRAVEVAAAVAVAVDRQKHRRLDLGEAVDDGLGAELRRGARPDRSEARASRGRPRRPRARWGGGRRPGRRDRRRGRRSPARMRATSSASRSPLQVASGPHLGRVVDGGRRRRARGEEMARVVQAGAREPLGAGHRARARAPARSRPRPRSRPRWRPRTRRGRPPTSATARRSPRAARASGRSG